MGRSNPTLQRRCHCSCQHARCEGIIQRVCPTAVLRVRCSFFDVWPYHTLRQLLYVPFGYPTSQRMIYSRVFPDLHTMAAEVYPLASALIFNPATRDWLPTALSDEAWFYTILHVAASMLATLTGSKHIFRDALGLQGEALRRLNHRIATGAVSDATMGAVSCFSMMTVCPPGTLSCVAHNSLAS